jgi:tetratricopeptide (TPR) repeat protein
LQHIGRNDEALSNYDKAIKMSPDFSDAYFDRANLRVATHHLADAIQDFDAVIRLRPDYAEAYKSRAVAHHYVKEYDKAWADVEACEKLGGRPEPDFIRALSRDSGRSR